METTLVFVDDFVPSEHNSIKAVKLVDDWNAGCVFLKMAREQLRAVAAVVHPDFRRRRYGHQMMFELERRFPDRITFPQQMEGLTPITVPDWLDKRPAIMAAGNPNVGRDDLPPYVPAPLPSAGIYVLEDRPKLESTDAHFATVLKIVDGRKIGELRCLIKSGQCCVGAGKVADEGRRLRTCAEMMYELERRWPGVTTKPPTGFASDFLDYWFAHREAILAAGPHAGRDDLPPYVPSVLPERFSSSGGSS